LEPEDYSDLIADLAPTPRLETVAVPEAIGRTTGADLIAPAPVPAFATSAMDGFALDSTAMQAAKSGEQVRVIGDTPAGYEAAPLQAGTAVRVMTGAPVPTGAKAVIPVELTDASPTGAIPQKVLVSSLPEDVRPGWNIRAVGEDIVAGDIVIPAGSRLTAAGIGTLAMLGVAEISVERTLRVGVIVTGDELRTNGEELGTNGTEASGPLILNSNLPMLASAIRATGAEAIEATCGDEPSALRSILGEMSDTADLVVTTGGISAGAFEVVRQALEGEHSTFLRLGMRPGSPQGHGRFGALPLLHLPGTPQGAFIAFHLFARSLLERKSLRARWKKSIFAGPALDLHRKALTVRAGTFTDTGEISAVHRSRLASFSGADVIVRIPRGPGQLRRGDVIDYVEC
jgi:molybdopterin molybdotransferase